MPLLAFFRTLAAIASLAVLAVAAWLLWSWWDGDWILRPDDAAAVHVREPWRLWTGLGLLAWSFAGRPIALLLLARPDRDPRRRSSPRHGEGAMIASPPTGSTLWVENTGPVGAAPIIFTHGWGMDSTFWDQARRDLSDRFRVITWDLPGLGRSRAADPANISVDAFAADLATLVETAGRAPAVLVGHSIGGMTIQTLVRDHSQIAQRLAGIVLLNTTHTNPLRTMLFSRLALALQKPVIEPMMRLAIVLHPLMWAGKWQSYLSGWSHVAHRLGFGRHVTRSQLEHVTLLSTRNPPAAEARGNLSMLHWDATGVMARFHKPVLVIGGDVDIVTKLEASERISKDADVPLEVAPDANHLAPMAQARLYDDLIADFALRVQPSATVDLPRTVEETDAAARGEAPFEIPRRP